MSAGLALAAAPICLMVVESNPCFANNSSAASRMRSRVAASDCMEMLINRLINSAQGNRCRCQIGLPRMEFGGNKGTKSLRDCKDALGLEGEGWCGADSLSVAEVGIESRGLTFSRFRTNLHIVLQAGCGGGKHLKWKRTARTTTGRAVAGIRA